MQRISTPTKAIDLFGAGKHGFKDGNLALGVLPTDLEADWFNDKQEELLNVVEGAGLVPDGALRSQLRDAISIMVRKQSAAISSATGSADVLIGAFTPEVPVLVNGLTLHLRAAFTNATTTPTFTPNDGVIAAKGIVKGAGLELVAGDISGDGHWLALKYDAVLDKWMLLNPALGVGILPLLDALQLADYAALRAYAGPRKNVYITGYLVTAAPSGIAGMFVRDDADATSEDNGGTIIVTAGGKRYKRAEKDSFRVSWFEAPTNGGDATEKINSTILAAQKSKAHQLSYDEIYSVEVLFDAGQDYSVLGTILLTSGIVLNGQGCRVIGDRADAGSILYDDGLPSTIESAYYDGVTIVSNRGAALNTKRLVGSGIKGFGFLNVNCAANLIQMNERSFVENCTISNASAAMRFKRCYYLAIDSIRATGVAFAANQYVFLLHGGNHNAMRLSRLTCGSGATVGISVSGPASSGTSIKHCTFEQSVNGTGIYFAGDSYCSAFDLSCNTFEGVRYGIVAAEGAGCFGVGIDYNVFNNTEYAVLSAPNALRVGSFRGNSTPDGGGVIRNLVDLGQVGNDVRYQIPSKTANSTTGPSSFILNVTPSNVSVAEASSSWTDTAAPNNAIAKASPGLANQSGLNELPFEGANIITLGNQVPFAVVTRAVDTLTIDTELTFDLANVLIFNFFGATDTIAFDLKGFVFGTVVSWVLHDPAGVVLTVSDYAGRVRFVFSSLPAAVPVINVSGMVRHA